MSDLLTQIRTLVTVDVDSMDPEVTRRHTSPTVAFCDMTSNQALVYYQITTLHDNAPIIQAAIRYAERQPGWEEDPAAYLQDVVDILTVFLAKEVYPHLRGKVHAQTSPSVAYDTEKTIQHAMKLVALFEAHGIPKSRVCIKIPATPESMVACESLQRIDINTLATCVFSLAQAQAAAQAGCTYVAPYFNELRAHSDSTYWRKYDNTAKDHPMSPVIRSMVHALKGTKTLVMPASIITLAEVLALVSLRPNHITISGTLLDQIGNLPAVPEERIAPYEDANIQQPLDKNYLADGAILLKEALMSDPEISRKLVDAISIFESYEKKIKEYIRSGIAGKEWDGQWP